MENNAKIKTRMKKKLSGRLGELLVSWQMEKQQFAAVVVVVVVPGTRKRSFAGVIHNKMRENEFFFFSVHPENNLKNKIK
jgi:hypothetical protein